MLLSKRKTTPRGRKKVGWGIWLIVAALVADLASVSAGLLAWDANNLAKTALEEQRVGTSWQILATKGTGATGKRYAIESLIKSQKQLVGFDLSCRTMDGNIDTQLADQARVFDCRFPTDLRNLTLVGDQTERGSYSTGLINGVLDQADLTAAKLQSVGLDKVSMRGSDLSGATFKNVTMQVVSLVGATVIGMDLAGVEMRRVDFSNTLLTMGSLTGVHSARDVNISGADFCPSVWFRDSGYTACVEVHQAFLDGTFFYEDNPPRNLHRAYPMGRVRRGCETPKGGPEGTELTAPPFCPTTWISTASVPLDVPLRPLGTPDPTIDRLGPGAWSDLLGFP